MGKQTVDESKLLRATAAVLRNRATAQRAQIEALAQENRALGQEVDIFSDAVDALIRERDDLRLKLSVAEDRIHELERKLGAKPAKAKARRRAA